MLPEINRDRVTDDVYEVLRRNILQQRFKAGERLRIDDLASQLDVSRTPVREALNLLAAEELVEIVPRSGTFVASLSVQDIEEVFDLRVALEGLAAERVARRGLSVEEQRRLREVLDRTGAALSDGDETIHQAEVNRAFHDFLVERAGNRKLSRIYRQLNAHTMMALIHYTSTTWRERWDQERKEHEAILDAIAQSDAAAAREAMEQHIQRAKTSLIADVERARSET